MKRTLFLFTFLFISMSKLLSNELLQKAEKAYDSKKYQEAIKAYEELLKDGYRSWQLYYNLGNSYYRDKQLGKAIYNYELARKLNPNDEDVRINLGIASAKTIDKIDSKENFFISAVKTNVLTSLDTGSWAWLGILQVFLLCVFIFAFISSGNVLMKRISFFVSVLLLISSVSFYFLGLSAMRAKHENKFAIITAKEVRIMNEPTTGATSKFNLHEGTRITVVENNGDWILIKLDNGNEGWVKVSEIGII